MYAEFMTDDELKAALVNAYVQHDDSPEIQEMKAELYHRGYEWEDIVVLALASLLRRYRYNETTPSLN